MTLYQPQILCGIECDWSYLRWIRKNWEGMAGGRIGRTEKSHKRRKVAMFPKHGDQDLSKSPLTIILPHFIRLCVILIPLKNYVTRFIVQDHPWSVDSYSTYQQIPCCYKQVWNLTTDHCVLRYLMFLCISLNYRVQISGCDPKFKSISRSQITDRSV
jgi:hypothetical protein